MDEIKQFKKEHTGDYIKYSPKELIGGLHTKFDKQAETMVDLQKNMTKLNTEVKWLKKLVFTLYGLIGTILIKPVRQIIQKIFGG